MKGADKTIFQGAITAIKAMVENEYKKPLEKIQMFFDYKENYLQNYFKFEGDMQKYGAEKHSLQDINEKSFSEIVLNAFKKEIPDFKAAQYANLFIDAKEKEIVKVEVYYLNKMDVPRIFEHPKN